MRIFILLMMTATVSGCCIFGVGMKYRTLGNGEAEVPSNVSAYANKSKFDSTILAIIDTSVIYERYNEYSKLPAREDSIYGNRYYPFIRFYPSGCFNQFIGYQDKELNIRDVNPEYTGARGVYYRSGKKIRFELFPKVFDICEPTKWPGVFTTKGDTLYMKYKSDKLPYVYVKRRIKDELMQFKADW